VSSDKQEKRVPNLKSSMKDMRVSERRRLRNRPIISATRTYVRRARAAIDAGDTAIAASAVGDAISALDKAASKGVIHRNNAARRKSRLMAKYNALGK
jgi:small subunit ribosomal protein S20